MGKMTLDEAFWHPKLGLVLAYLFIHEGRQLKLPNGKVLDSHFEKREYMVFPEVSEEGAPYMVDFAMQFQDEQP